MSLADRFRRTCSVAPTVSRRPSHALLAYDGNMVAYAKLRSFALLPEVA